MGDLIATHQLISLDHQNADQVYNALDCAVTFEVWEQLQKNFNESPMIYNFERALQAPALEIMMRGFKIDQLERDRAIKALRAEHSRLESILHRYATAIWGKGVNARSGPQLKDLFYNHMKLPEVWTSIKGVKDLRMNRETLEKIEVYFHARPIVACVLGIRELEKKLQVLESEVDPDGRMRTSINVGATETGRFSSSKSTTGTGCVLPTTEVLTKYGWDQIQYIQEGTEIAQWSLDGKIEFVPCKMFKTEFEGSMLQMKTEQVQQTLTPGHRVVFQDFSMTKWIVESAQIASGRSQIALPLGGFYRSGKLDYPKYVAMLMADFEKTPWQWRGSFKKNRKKERFLQLAEEFNLNWHELKTDREDYRRFAVKTTEDYPKKWGSWILDLTYESACGLLEEARHWDSTDMALQKANVGPSFTFFTADKEQATWFATLAHICGKSASIRMCEQSAESWSTTVMWHVHVKERKHARVYKKHWTPVPYTGTVYCPQVPSSYWLMRENNYISVTGNTNMFNISEKMRRMFIADPGWKLAAIDAEQAESREVGWICWKLFGDSNYLDACEAGDLHTATCRLVWPNRAWTGDSKKDRLMAEEIFYRHYSYRDMSKRGGHGTNYFGQPFQIARQLKVPPKLVEDFQDKYFTAYPGITKWHRWVAEQLQTTQQITTSFGRDRHFFGRPNDDATLREAIAYEPQSCTADRVNIGLLRIWEQMGKRVQVLLQLYDAVYFQYREDDNEAEVLNQALALMDVPLWHNGRKFTVPGEVKVGWNWASAVTQADVDLAIKRGQKPPALNLDGLKKWKGSDDRRRTSLLDRIM